MINGWSDAHPNNSLSGNGRHLNGVGLAPGNRLREAGQVGIIDALRHCRLFRNFEGSRLHSIAALTTPKFLPKGRLLFLSGDPLHGFFIVRAGSIKLSRINCEGKEQVLHVFRAGESFAEEALVSEAGFPGDASALEDSVVLLVQKAGFLDLLRRQPELSLCILSAAAQHTNDLMNLVADLKLLDVQTRLVKWLVTDCQQHRAQPDSQGRRCVELSMTKRVLAAELGISSETLSRTLAKLSEQGLLLVNGNRITLLSLAKLESLADSYAESSQPSTTTHNGWRQPIIRECTLAA